MGIKKLSELVTDFVLLITGVGLWISAQTIETGTTMGKGSDFMPKVCTAVWVILAVILLLQTLKMADDKDKTLKMSLKGFLLTFLYLAVYMFLLNVTGFIISSILYMFAQMMLYVPETGRTKKNVILFAVLSAAVPIAVNILFVNAFSLLLPAGSIF
ncbi:tripartite tricarboxylate transporter TctB family protein [Clostridium sp. AM58-1XD]|uniref:tripartite tricarboxylate transporter TctB family protein n=1 Tax=Clostridium sp. AM58-1XD TaxID=2292307 RepID=UPI0015F45DDB|nr:tripartite tricarboxylate transporter TctB family protein [Clostridium sp. AM58-1XD]